MSSKGKKGCATEPKCKQSVSVGVPNSHNEFSPPQNYYTGEPTLFRSSETLLTTSIRTRDAVSVEFMASAQQSPAQQTTSSWTEPPWSGWIGTTEDALLILEAARRGLIPRVTRRLVDSERKMITSGSVFVFDEDESGIKRWTDGFFWSPSRILGNFLLYRETEKRGAGHRSIKADQDLNREALELQNQDLDNPLVDKSRQRCLMGSLMNTNTYKFKPEGLMKKVRP